MPVTQYSSVKCYDGLLFSIHSVTRCIDRMPPRCPTDDAWYPQLLRRYVGSTKITIGGGHVPERQERRRHEERTGPEGELRTASHPRRRRDHWVDSVPEEGHLHHADGPRRRRRLRDGLL